MASTASQSLTWQLELKLKKNNNSSNNNNCCSVSQAKISKGSRWNTSRLCSISTLAAVVIANIAADRGSSSAIARWFCHLNPCQCCGHAFGSLSQHHPVLRIETDDAFVLVTLAELLICWIWSCLCTRWLACVVCGHLCWHLIHVHPLSTLLSRVVVLHEMLHT